MKIYINRKFYIQKICLLLLVFFCTGCGRKEEIYVLDTQTSDAQTPDVQNPDAQNMDVQDSNSQKEKADWMKPGQFQTSSEEGEGNTTILGETTPGSFVYVCGEVCEPGVYELRKGARVCDAIEAAGGMTKEACTTYWNLAKPVADGDMIYVPTEEEAKELKEGFLEGQDTEAFEQDQSGKKGKISINSATKEQLMSIPGIGEAKAGSIIEYRTKNGKFRKVEDLMNISGIKEGMFQKIKDYITL